MTSASSSSSTTGELVDALEVDEERRRHVARRPLATDVDVVVGNGPGAAVDDGLDDRVDVELVAVVGVVDAHPPLGADERELAADAAGEHGVAPPDVADERGVVAVQPLFEHPAPRPQVAAVVVAPLVVAEGAGALELVGRRVDQVGRAAAPRAAPPRARPGRGPASRRAARRGGSARRPAPCRWTAGGARRRRAARHPAAAAPWRRRAPRRRRTWPPDRAAAPRRRARRSRGPARTESSAVASTWRAAPRRDEGRRPAPWRATATGRAASRAARRRRPSAAAGRRRGRRAAGPAARSGARRAPRRPAHRGRVGRPDSGGGRRRRRGRPRGS